MQRPRERRAQGRSRGKVRGLRRSAWLWVGMGCDEGEGVRARAGGEDSSSKGLELTINANLDQSPTCERSSCRAVPFYRVK